LVKGDYQHVNVSTQEYKSGRSAIPDNISHHMMVWLVWCGGGGRARGGVAEKQKVAPVDLLYAIRNRNPRLLCQGVKVKVISIDNNKKLLFNFSILT
jgi:hypothetical protein